VAYVSLIWNDGYTFFNGNGGFRHDPSNPSALLHTPVDSSGNPPVGYTLMAGSTCEQANQAYMQCLTEDQFWDDQADAAAEDAFDPWGIVADEVRCWIAEEIIASTNPLGPVAVQMICAFKDGVDFANVIAFSAQAIAHSCTPQIPPGASCPPPESPDCPGAICLADQVDGYPRCVYPSGASCTSSRNCGGASSCDEGICWTYSQPEVCDNYDNDCDLIVDGFVTRCGIGACASTGTCNAGVDSCTPGTPASNDSICNAIDDDCDGSSDEDFVPSATSCGVGVCAASGQLSCNAGVLTDTCVPGTPTIETCDGIDNNCNGTVDEGCSSSSSCLEVSGAGWVEALDSNSLDLRGDLTIETWALVSPSATYFPAVTKWDDFGTGFRAYFLTVRDHPFYQGRPRFTWSVDTGQSYDLVGPTVVEPNTWHHFAAVRYGAMSVLYIDGAPVADAAQSTALVWNSGEPLRIGMGYLYSVGAVFATGLLDNVRLWNVARSQADIQASRFGLIGSPAGLVGHWTFDETSGAALDSSGNGNHGVFQGDALRVSCSRPQSEGCSDGTREGLVDTSAYPDVAACAGSWSGRIDGTSAAALCAQDWHVCSPADPNFEVDSVTLATVSYAAAVAVPGCFPFNASQDGDTCFPCTGLQPADDMGAVGANCTGGHYSPNGTSCLGSGRVDADCCGAYTTDHACSQNIANPYTGVACCRFISVPI
jgi:hypothetical protein